MGTQVVMHRMFLCLLKRLMVNDMPNLDSTGQARVKKLFSQCWQEALSTFLLELAESIQTAR